MGGGGGRGGGGGGGRAERGRRGIGRFLLSDQGGGGRPGPLVPLLNSYTGACDILELQST